MKQCLFFIILTCSTCACISTTPEIRGGKHERCLRSTMLQNFAFKGVTYGEAVSEIRTAALQELSHTPEALGFSVVLNVDMDILYGRRHSFSLGALSILDAFIALGNMFDADVSYRDGIIFFYDRSANHDQGANMPVRDGK